MIASAGVIPLTVSEASAFERFRAAEHTMLSIKPVTGDEMIDVILGERERIERSSRVAEATYGAPFDAREVRRCVVLQRAAEFLGIIEQHKDDVREVLTGRHVPKRRRV